MDDRLSTFRGPAQAWLQARTPHGLIAPDVRGGRDDIALIVWLCRPPVLPMSLSRRHCSRVCGIGRLAVRNQTAWRRHHFLGHLGRVRVLIGCAAAMLSKPENVLQVFRHATGPNTQTDQTGPLWQRHAAMSDWMSKRRGLFGPVLL